MKKKLATPFYFKYIQPRLDAVINPLHNLSPLEKAYYERMMTFVYREQLAAKVGEQEGVGNSTADLWNMPLANKKGSRQHLYRPHYCSKSQEQGHQRL